MDKEKYIEGIKKNFLIQKEEKNNIWEHLISTSEHLQMKESYYKICPSNMVFFDVKQQGVFLDQTRSNYEYIKDIFSNTQEVPRWNEKEMDRMFGKGLNPTSLITSLESAEWFVKNIQFNPSDIVLELGPGAGWGTVMLYNTLMSQSGNARIITTDKSLHSLAATMTLLEYSGIQYIVASSNDELRWTVEWLNTDVEGLQFSGVVLSNYLFNDIVNILPVDSIVGTYSSHGTAYLTREEYKELLTHLQNVMKNNGIFIADSLNPLYTNRLNKLLTISQMLFPRFTERLLTKRGVKYIDNKKVKVSSNSKYFKNQKVTVLQGFNTPHAYLIFKWCNHLIKSLNIKRFLDTKKSLEVTMEVVEAYRDDVFPSYLLLEIVKELKLNYDLLEGRPDFPIFMDTVGLKLRK